METVKKNLANLVLFAALGAAVMFFYAAVFIEKEWQVSGKLIVVPSGSTASVKNLELEVGNTKAIIESPKFQENVFAEQAANYTRAEIDPQSSVVEMIFLAKEEEIERAENLFAAVPGEVANYARDLYGGDPFKYRLVADPVVSASPVMPDVMRNSLTGAIAGMILYVLGVLFFSASQGEVKKLVASSEPAKGAPIEKNEVMREVEAQLQKKEEPIDFSETREKVKIEEAPARVQSQSVPSNLPTGEGGQDEPTDEEIKNRLNKLMRGEL